MRITVFTIFPELIQTACKPSLLGSAIEKGILEVVTIDPREKAADRHRTMDDVPFGGGAGMVLLPEPVAQAIDEELAKEPGGASPRMVVLSPGGRVFDQDLARELALCDSLYLVCGRYKGIDDRVRAVYGAEELSIGDYVLSGGELPALVVIDAVARLLPGVMGDFGSAEDDAIFSGILSAPEYTKPRVFRGLEVPEVLLSGHHERIRKWKRRAALARTLERRPDLLDRAKLSAEDLEMLREIRAGHPAAESQT
jgi:tRNA (guanine37-N1)-methyltransferase